MEKALYLESKFPGINRIAEKALKWRNHIHSFPELSFEEFETAAFVENILKNLELKNIRRLTPTGVTATLHQEDTLPCIGLRADLDALPITESNLKTLKSRKDGIMHACGHDAHTACLLGAANYLVEKRKDIRLNVKFIFQPGEEKLPGGASLLIKEGVLENPNVEAIYGIHVTPEIPSGQFGLRPGAFMASTDELHIRVIGKPGHAALHGSYINPVLVGSTLVHRCMSEVEKNFPDFGTEYILAFGDFHAAGATNVIPAEAHIKGTLRTFSESQRNQIHQFLLQQSNIIEADTGAKIIFEVRMGYPVLHNDPSLTQKTIASLRNLSETENILDLNRRMTAEDFAWYSQKIPACFIRWGTGNEKKGIRASVHTPEFDIDEDSIVYGIAAFLECVMQHQ